MKERHSVLRKISRQTIFRAKNVLPTEVTEKLVLSVAFVTFSLNPDALVPNKSISTARQLRRKQMQEKISRELAVILAKQKQRLEVKHGSSSGPGAPHSSFGPGAPQHGPSAAVDLTKVKAAAAKSVVDAKREPVKSGCMAAYESATGVAAEAKQTMDARMQAGEGSTHASAQAYVVDEMVHRPREKREAADAKSEGNRRGREDIG